jgi:hypothetical protein
MRGASASLKSDLELDIELCIEKTKAPGLG